MPWGLAPEGIKRRYLLLGLSGLAEGCLYSSAPLLSQDGLGQGEILRVPLEQ